MTEGLAYDEDREDRRRAGLPWVPPVGSVHWRQGLELIISPKTSLVQAIERTNEHIRLLQLSLESNPKFLEKHPQVRTTTEKLIETHLDDIAHYKYLQFKGHQFVSAPND